MLKVDMLFTQSTNKAGASEDSVRTAGWSEGWYINVDPDTARVRVNNLCLARAVLLTNACSIVGQRYRVVGGGSSTDNRRYPGVSTNLADIPAMGVLCTMQGSGVPNTRRFILRGLADARVVEGEYIPSLAFEAGLDQLDRVLAEDGFRFKGRLLTATTVDVVGITDLGVLTAAAPIVVLAGNKVRLLRATNEDGDSVSGQYYVGTVTDSTHFTIANWSGGIVHKGKVRIDSFDYFPLVRGSLSRGRVVTHKVGRSFFQFVGRRSRRR